MTPLRIKYILPLLRLIICCSVMLPLFISCRKSEYNFVPQPAYLRVFNTLKYKIDLTNKGKPVPFLIMVIDPQFDEQGILTGGVLKGDFLDVRKRYGSPTSNAASTDFRNYEFPGSIKIPVAPIINGFDLSNWAQVPSGQHRFVFYTRPQNQIPFFELSREIRKEQLLLADTLLTLQQGEVYTMNILEKVYNRDKLSTLVYLRQEKFQKMAFADSLNYINFYNLSAEGFVQAHPEGAQNIGYFASTGTAIKDNVNIFFSILKNDIGYPMTIINNEYPRLGNEEVPGYQKIPLQQLVRSHSPEVTPYTTIPLFVGQDTTNRIFSNYWTRLELIPPGGGLGGNTQFSPAAGNIIALTNYSNEGRIQITAATGFLLPSMIRQVASGPYLQRSFSTISCLEYINKEIYLTSVMKVYPAPQTK